MSRTFILFFVVFGLCLSVSAQVAPEAQPLVPGQPVEREIAGGESHTYQISLSAGQFVRIVVEQKSIDLSLAIAAPDGKQVAVVNLTRPGGTESLSIETAVGGDYQLTLRALAPARITGAYLLRTESRAPTAEDKQRITAEGLLVQANALVSQSNTAERAVEPLNKALVLWRAIGDRYWEANTLNLLARAYGSLSLNEKAIEYAEQGLAIHREIKNLAGQASALNTIGTSSTSLGRIEKSVEHQEQALVAVREVQDRVAEGLILGNLAGNNNSLGQYEKAIEYAERSLLILREMNNRFLEGRALAHLGRAYESLGRQEKAGEFYEQSLVIAREVKDRGQESTVLRNLSFIYIRDRFGRAKEYAEQALAIAREIKDRRGEGQSLNTLGNAYRQHGQLEKAIEYYEQSLAIARELKSRIDEANALGSIGGRLLDLKRYDKAIVYSEQALAIARELNLRPEQATFLADLASAYADLNSEKSRAYNEQALTIARELKRPDLELYALLTLMRLHNRLHQPQRVKEYAMQGLSIAIEIGDRERQARLLAIRAEAERDLGNLLSARNFIEEAVQVAESTRSEIFVQEARSTLLVNWWYVYDLQVDILMRLHKADPAGGFDARALAVAERAHGRSLVEMLSEAGADIRKGVDLALLDRERKLSSQISARAAARTQMLNRPQTAAQATVLTREINQLESDYDAVRSEIRRASPRYAALTQPQTLSLKEIQQQLDPDTLLLEYWLGDPLGREGSYLWAVTNNSIASYELPKSTEVAKAARLVYDLLTSRSRAQKGETAAQRNARLKQADAQLTTAGQQLSQMILGPVASELGSRRLVIVADGALQYIPFAMLPEPSVVSSQLSGAKNNGPRTTNNGQPLIVKHEIISLPSASALAIQRRELAGRQLAPKMLAVIADPVFDRSDSRFATPATETGDKTQTQTITADDARSIEHLAGNSGDKSGLTTLRLIPRLPFTRQEATRVLALTPRNSSFAAIDFQASRATTLDPALGQYRYLHFATHGYLDSERPGLSALLFSMVDAQGKPLDGFLRANDIYNLKLPAELVVLSACQTGLGKDIKGEGLVGLTRGFMYAGAARVVVSLWNVNDKATADLMTKFYEKMLKQGQSPAAALRAAQVEMWKQKQWQSPYYWAAFTMQGEWR